MDNLAAFLHHAADGVLLTKLDADRAEARGDLGVGGGVEGYLHNLNL
jgi:hypothetical protein